MLIYLKYSYQHQLQLFLGQFDGIVQNSGNCRVLIPMCLVIVLKSVRMLKFPHSKISYFPISCHNYDFKKLISFSIERIKLPLGMMKSLRIHSKKSAKMGEFTASVNLLFLNCPLEDTPF